MGIIKKLCDCKLLHEKIAGDTNFKKKNMKLPSESVRSFTIMCCHVFSMYFLCSRLGFTLKRYGRAYNFVPSVGFKVSPMRSGSRVNVGLNMFKYVKMGMPCSEILGSFYPILSKKTHRNPLHTTIVYSSIIFGMFDISLKMEQIAT